MRFIRDFLDDVIPNELKNSNIAKAAALVGTSYLGFKYAPAAYRAAKEFIGSPSKVIELSEYGMGTRDYTKPATGMYAIADKFQKYSDNPLVKFGKGMVGTKIKDGQETQASGDEYLAQLKALNERYSANPYSQAPIPSGNFSTSQIRSPGFSNTRVQEGLMNMAAYMQDLADNGRIDSSALYAEGPRGTTVKVGSAGLKNLRQIS